MGKIFLVLAVLLPFSYGCDSPDTGALTEAIERAAESGITLADYEAIENGMSLKEVEGMLGKGTELSEVTGDGLPTFRTMQWQNGDGSNITLSLEDDIVASKAQFGLE